MTDHPRSELLYASYEEHHPEWHLSAHTHSHHELVVVVGGREKARFLGETRLAGTDEVLLFPAGQPHEEWSQTGAVLVRYVLGFTWSGYRPGTPVHVRDGEARLRRLAEWLHAERESPLRGAQAFRDTLLQSMLAEYGRLCEAAGWSAFPQADSPLVEAVQTYVQGRLAEPFTLDDLAQHVGFSKYYLVRSYRALTGLTPMDHARLIRLEAARHLLLTTSLPLKTIAPRVGFASEYHLSRLLRSRLGIGARELRRRIVESGRSAALG